MTPFRILANGRICCSSTTSTGERVPPRYPCAACKAHFQQDEVPDPYASDTATLRAAMATPASRFEKQYATERLREFAKEQPDIDAHVDSAPRLTSAELAEWDPPDPYSAHIKALQAKEAL